MNFVWGVNSKDLPGEYDIELAYNDKNKTFNLNIETILYFPSKQSEINHYKHLLDAFTEWMNKMSFDINHPMSLNDICYFNSRDFESIESAYAWFKFVVESYAYIHDR